MVRRLKSGEERTIDPGPGKPMSERVSAGWLEVAELETAVPAEAVAGSRYPAPMMATLASER